MINEINAHGGGAAQNGKSLADAPRAAPFVQTQVFDVALREADARIADIIAAQAGRAAAAPAPKPAARRSGGAARP